MKSIFKILIIFFLFPFALMGQSINELKVNGKIVDYNNCYEVKMVKQLPQLLSGFVCEVREAQIIGDCLELSVVYGGCNGNLELMTDHVINSQSQLVFMPRWAEPSMCKAMTAVKILFDLKPYKSFIKEQSATIKIANSNFDLFYN